MEVTENVEVKTIAKTYSENCSDCGATIKSEKSARHLIACLFNHKRFKHFGARKTKGNVDSKALADADPQMIRLREQYPIEVKP
jgi:hypothetical protein